MATGMVTLEGNLQDIHKKLEMDSETKIPQVFFTVYQHIFTSIYLLSSVLDTPYPPPDLLHPMQEKIQILTESGETEASQPQPEQPTELTQTAESAETTEKTTEEQSKPTEEPEIAAEAATREDAETVTANTV